MEKQTAEALAKKSFAFIKSAAKSGVAAITQSVSSVRKGYASKHEADVLAELRSQGLHPAEHFHAGFSSLNFAALRKLNYLYLSGYKHELQAASQQAAKRLTDLERSTVPLDALLRIGGITYEESLRYGDFHEGKLFQGLQDFLNKARMGDNHFDRDKLSHDLYYSTLYLAEGSGFIFSTDKRVLEASDTELDEWLPSAIHEYESDLTEMEKICREVVSHVITTAPAPDISSQPKQNDPSQSSQYYAAKACFYYSMALNTAVQEREDKRLKALREAEAMVQREQEKIAQALQRSTSKVFPQ